MRRFIALVLCGLSLWPISADGRVLRFKFIGSGAEYATIYTSDLREGGRFSCGQSNQGAPDCRLQEAQQCCQWDIAGNGFDYGGQTITIYVPGSRASAYVKTTFIDWDGVCEAAPVPCNDPTEVWCKNGLDRRGGGTCTLTLPVEGGDDVDVIAVFEKLVYLQDHDLCGPNGGPTGTCNTGATTTTTTTPTTPPTTMPGWKDEARELMQHYYEQSLYPCLMSALGAGVIAVPPLAVGVTAGGTMLAVAAPVCAHHVQMLLMLRRAYDDPPRPDYDRLARVDHAAESALELPACPTSPRSDRTSCRRLERLATRYVGAVARSESVAVALGTTSDRYGGAVAAGDAKAARKQSRHAGKLARKVDAASRAQARAGGRLADALRAIGVTGTLDEPGFGQATGIVLAALAAQGLPEDSARAILGDAVAPRTIDLLTVLGREP